jgi:hypothetical protein
MFVWEQNAHTKIPAQSIAEVTCASSEVKMINL